MITGPEPGIRRNSQTNSSTSSHNCITIPFFYVASSGSDVAQNASQSSDWLTDCVFQLPVHSLVGPGVRPACPGSILAPHWPLLLKGISRSENFRDFMYLLCLPDAIQLLFLESQSNCHLPRECLPDGQFSI